MLGAGLSVSAVALRRGGPPEWPEGAVALWLILGQSNAQGYAPWRQDPAQADPAAAVPALSAEERAVHPWARFSLAGSGAEAGRFALSGHGLATETTPRTSPHVWQAGNPHGIPAGTQSFGPEIGLIRHVLEGGAPAGWRDDAEPRLYVFKQTEGGRSVDHFRWGGPGQGLVLDALRQASGETLESLAAAKTVLLQGIVFAIGDKDCTTPEPDGSGSMNHSLEVRFRDWVRQIRGALGCDAPAAFVELETADARKIEGNAQIAALAASLPNAAVIPRGADWTDVGDGLHYDAQGMDRMGRAFFAHFRQAYGRGGDGLVTGFPFTGLKPWFHVPPQFIDEAGAQMRIATTASASGVLHARITGPGVGPPPATEIRDRSAEPGGFHRNVAADAETAFWSFTEFEAGALQDCHFVLEADDGTLGEVVTATRPDNARFGPDLSASPGAGSVQATIRPSFTGTLTWSLLPGTRDHIRREDVEAKAFLPVRWGQSAAQANTDAVIDISGLASGADYTLFVTGERGADGRKALLQRAAFSTL